ncbi:DOK1 protein, partial [Columbina picui]|nr:DOK1 protein [Columbina picui]
GRGFLRHPLSAPVPAVNAFWVTVQRTEAAERCELRGTYVLKAERDSLVLKDPRTNEALYVWPYRLLRRYGRDKVGVRGCLWQGPRGFC